MALSHDSYAFGGYSHTIVVAEPSDQPIRIDGRAGARGVTVLVDETKAARLSCRLNVAESTKAAMLTAVREIDTKRGKLTGDLVDTAGGTATWPNAVFLGWEPVDEPFYDVSQTRWVHRIRLLWIQTEAVGAS